MTKKWIFSTALVMAAALVLVFVVLVSCSKKAVAQKSRGNTAADSGNSKQAAKTAAVSAQSA